MGLGNARAENLTRKSLCEGTEQIDPFSNETSILFHKSCLSGIYKNRIKAGTFCLYHWAERFSPWTITEKEALFVDLLQQGILSDVFHPSCGACAVYYQYWLLMPRSQLSPKCSAVTWVLSSELSMSLHEMDTAVKPVVYFNGPDVREKFCHGRWSCLLILMGLPCLPI